MSTVFFLTGSSRGLGRAIAQAVLDAGDQLVATARTRRLARRSLRQIRRSDPAARARCHRRRRRPGCGRPRHRTVRSDRRGRQQRRLRQPCRRRGHHALRLPRPDRDELLWCRQRHQGSAPGPARARAPVTSSRCRRSAVDSPPPDWRRTSPRNGRSADSRACSRPKSRRSGSTSPCSSPAECRPTGRAHRCRSHRSQRPTSRPSARAPRCTTPTNLALGDPAKVAQVVLQVGGDGRPSKLRLILGSEAYTYATAAARAQAEADERWRELTVSTDRDDATDADRDPIAARRG